MKREKIVGEWQTDAQGRKFRRVQEGKLRYTEYEMRIQTNSHGEVTETMLESLRNEGKEIE